MANHMSSPVIVANPEMDLLEAIHLMGDKKIRRLPITENGHLVGLVSGVDAARAMFHPMLHLLMSKSAEAISVGGRRVARARGR